MDISIYIYIYTHCISIISPLPSYTFRKHHNHMFKARRSPSPTILSPRRKWPRKSFGLTLPCGRVCEQLLDARRMETTWRLTNRRVKNQVKLGIQLENSKTCWDWSLEMAKFGRWRHELYICRVFGDGKSKILHTDIGKFEQQTRGFFHAQTVSVFKQQKSSFFLYHNN